jgi:hypothetical protein
VARAVAIGGVYCIWEFCVSSSIGGTSIRCRAERSKTTEKPFETRVVAPRNSF